MKRSLSNFFGSHLMTDERSDISHTTVQSRDQVNYFIFFLILLLSACSNSTLWKFDSIVNGEPTFDSAKLVYCNPRESPMTLEFIRIGSEIEAFVNLTKYKFTNSSYEKTTMIQLKIDEHIIEEEIPRLQGNMRLRLPPQLTQWLLCVLQEDKEVVILIDGFEQQVHPEYFKKYFKQLTACPAFLQNPFKGLLES